MSGADAETKPENITEASEPGSETKKRKRGGKKHRKGEFSYMVQGREEETPVSAGPEERPHEQPQVPQKTAPTVEKLIQDSEIEANQHFIARSSLTDKMTRLRIVGDYGNAAVAAAELKKLPFASVAEKRLALRVKVKKLLICGNYHNRGRLQKECLTPNSMCRKSISNGSSMRHNVEFPTSM